MPPSLTPGSSIVVSVQNIDVDIGLRHGPKGSALPMIPQSVSRGARISGLLWFADCYGLSGCWPPCTDLTGLPANGGFYFQAFDRSVALPVAGYDYNSDWTPLLAGLSPAGMAASFAAPDPARTPTMLNALRSIDPHGRQTVACGGGIAVSASS